MSQRIFEQLDRLERGARIEPRPSRETYHDDSADFSGYGGSHASYSQHAPRFGAHDNDWDGYSEQPLTLDSFDEQLLRRPDFNSRQDQALLGNARITLPPARRHAEPVPHGGDVEPFASQRPNLSQFAFEGAPQGQASSSPFNQPLRSSPAFHASQRRPAPLNLARPEPSFAGRDSSRYQPVTAQQIDAEIEEYGDENADPQVPPPPTRAQPPTALKAAPASIGPPVVQGINLVPTHTLPDRFRALFPYPLFNAVQSKCFNTLYKSNENFVLSAPTGSGKTVALELAICRLINGFAVGSYKIVYQAPTKSLCSQRFRDWQAKFGPLDLQCVELTGDTDNVSQRDIQQATIIITTPEKWDSMTRKWKDQQKLVRMVRLFLIDEVHILKEDRGATLEAVVSRMKSVGSDVRFIALSATVPNSEDLATWLGKDPMHPDVPAARERFGEEFRPVKLKKHVVGYRFDGNDFAFDKTLSGKLLEVIPKYSQRKPIMVFCFTRPACVETAKTLSNWWATKNPSQRYWSQPRQRIAVADKDLADTISSGVAFHHAGLSIQDRTAVEKGYLSGEISVICCTSTLAVGVNLPCHMVIIKNTVAYQGSGCKEYSDLETMQMLGRAGRPQFDDSAVAVIMTRLHRVGHYEKMITGQEILESCLHRNLIDHLNAEIGLGTITNASSAKKWLAGTFLYVRLKENPEHYKFDGDPTARNLDERLETICGKGIALLENHDLISKVPKLHCTEFGDAMARYYLQFDTMKVFLALPPKAKVSEILSALSQAAEFKDVRFRAGEKQAYRDLNKNSSIKFPLPGTLDTPAHKISLVIQSVLGSVDFAAEDYKLRLDYTTSKSIILNNASRLIRCIIDCQLYLEDAVAARNALALARSLGAQVWDDSPLHIKQLDGIGPVSVRKFVGAGIKSIDNIENTEAHRIEKLLSRNPPFGTEVLNKAKAFPRLRVSVQMVGEPVVKKGEHVGVKIKADVGFLNDKVPLTFNRKAVYVCLLAETSDGRMIHFARIGAKKLDKGQDVLFSANLTSATQTIRAYVMCDEIAGTARHASFKPEIPAIAFPPPKTAEDMNKQRGLVTHAPNIAKRRTSDNTDKGGRDNESDEFGIGGLDDADLAQAEADAFIDIDEFDDNPKEASQPPKKKQKTSLSTQANAEKAPVQLSNGKWACNHACKDKTQCKHLCCREGLDKPPKAKQAKAAQEKKSGDAKSDPRQTQLDLSASDKRTTSKTKSSVVVRSVEKTTTTKPRKQTADPKVRDLDRLHNSVKTNTPKVPVLGSGNAGKASQHAPLSLLGSGQVGKGRPASSDYGDDSFGSNDLPSAGEILATQRARRDDSPEDRAAEINHEDEEMLDTGYVVDEGDAMSQPFEQGRGDGYVDLSSYTDEYGRQAHDQRGGASAPEADFFPDSAPAEAQEKATTKEDRLFVGYSTDSATNDFGLSRGGSGKSQPTTTKEPSIPQTSKFFPATQRAGPSRTPSAQRREQERFNAALPPDEFIAEINADLGGDEDKTTKEADEPSSPDELKKWAIEEFGTELFNLTW